MRPDCRKRKGCGGIHDYIREQINQRVNADDIAGRAPEPCVYQRFYKKETGRTSGCYPPMKSNGRRVIRQRHSLAHIGDEHRLFIESHF
jgi:hypothetical protein